MKKSNDGDGGQAGTGCEEAEVGRGMASGDVFGMGGRVDLSSVGAALFRERDPEGSGSVSLEVFREVKCLCQVWTGRRGGDLPAAG